jgi:ribosomal protein S18 acetylase RimI-like enzyme
MSPAIAVELLEPPAAKDRGLAERLTALVNDVYATAEAGLWRDGATRTTPSELVHFIEAGQIAVATVGDRVAGVVRAWPISDVTAEFGLLAADPAYRGIGIGRSLVLFAERHCHARGLRAMQLELLVPRTGRHPSKEFLDAWYRRIGYRVARRTKVEDADPQRAPLLATPCDFVVYEKPLDREAERPPGS